MNSFNQAADFMIYPDPESEKPKRFSKWIIAMIALFIVCAIATVVAIILNHVPSSTEGTGDTPISDADIETSEYIVDNFTVVSAIVNAAKTGNAITKVQCDEMLRHGNKYASLYGGKQIDTSFCNTSTISIATAREVGASYPNEKMTVIYMQSGNNCLKFPFYSSLYSMQDYKATNAVCPVKTTPIEVKK